MATQRHTPVHLVAPHLHTLDTREPAANEVRRPRDEAQERAAPEQKRWSLELFRAAYDRLGHDDGDGLAAGLAFGAMLSIAPLLLVVLGISSAVLGDEQSRAQLERLVRESLGQPAVAMIDQWITDAREWSGGATAVGVIMFLVGSARLVGLVDGAFKMVFDVEPPAKAPSFLESVKAFFTTQAKTLGVTLGAGLLMVISLVLRALGESLFGGFDSDVLDVLWIVGREIVSFWVWVGALALVYWALPPIRLHPRDIFHGALVSALLVEATLLVLRLGASVLDLGAAYGTASAIVGVLLTLYIVSQLFLFGAEVTAELASRCGMKVRSSRDGGPRRVAPPSTVPVPSARASQGKAP